ncbi:hypothetical protein AWM68_19845 [Fictibacillus phosphorivorans]|uniref:DUF2634 domain-containing protein n=1 Tax=Fictibacillus phosphorivorans TaxID=1221500 RepID=A0A163RK89_9BACL|nr:DUF2634 domain-containing protein [Fictibacillus phosphorivorans]KZE66996.1 hypothetical protein AWM68_19845 [Fictibacillus phosphorivorans]
MNSILLNPDGDFVFEQGSFLMVKEDEELAQSVRMVLQTALEEWFLNEEFGLNREVFLNKLFNENEARDSIIEALSLENRISLVEEIKFKKVGRKLLIDLVLLKNDNTSLLIEGVNLNA